MSSTVRAHTNIALVKYWGKSQPELKIPFNSSVSLTLDQFYTETTVIYDSTLTHDVLVLDGALSDDKISRRVTLFMDEVRRRFGITDHATIVSDNFVPTEAGLASSASAFAALAKASTLSLNLSDQELSRLARWGSGSACRSIYGGFVRWDKGTHDEDSLAAPIAMDPWDDFRMIACLVNQQIKPFSSSAAMAATVAQSPYYEAWVHVAERDSQAMETALRHHDIRQVGALAQSNALKMHATLLGADLWYFEPQTIAIMNQIRQLQKSIPVYFTMDAGPNIKLITTKQHVDAVIDALGPIPSVVCCSGPGVFVK